MSAATIDRASMSDLEGGVTATAIFGLLGGPAAWFAQLNAGFLMASGPCFPHELRLPQPPSALQWTHVAMVVVTLLAIVIALAAFIVSRQIYHRSGAGQRGRSAGRTRFLALWGMFFGAGFAMATAFNAVAFIFLPRCTG